jgi:glycosyltransferase involved in cell wall biosynthesis
MVGAFPFPSVQGTQVYAAGMAGALAARGHRVRLATYPFGMDVGPDRGWPAGVERLPVPRPPVAAELRSGPSLGKPALDAALTAALVGALRRGRPDVLHAHHGEAALAALAARRLARVDVPVIYNLHTSYAEELPVYTPLAAQPWLTPPLAALGGWLDREISARVDAAIAPSARGASLLRAWGAPRVISAIPGVDAAEVAGGDAAAATRRWNLDDRPWVLYAGNLDAYQDVDVLLDAMRRLPGIGLLVVSSTPPAEVHKRCVRAGLDPSRVRATGAADLGALRDALAAVKIAAIPRRTCAGFPMKLLNQLAGGVVTVASTSVAPPLEGVIAVPPGDAAALAAALQSLIDDPEMTERLGAQAARGIRSRWTWDRAVAPIEALYDALCGDDCTGAPRAL